MYGKLHDHLTYLVSLQIDTYLVSLQDEWVQLNTSSYLYIFLKSFPSKLNENAVDLLTTIVAEESREVLLSWTKKLVEWNKMEFCF